MGVVSLKHTLNGCTYIRLNRVASRACSHIHKRFASHASHAETRTAPIIWYLCGGCAYTVRPCVSGFGQFSAAVTLENASFTHTAQGRLRRAIGATQTPRDLTTRLWNRIRNSVEQRSGEYKVIAFSTTFTSMETFCP